MTNETLTDVMDVHEYPVHPYADVFPMLNEAELNELADDIADNGLNEPLVLQRIEGVETLIDGRNRRAACAIAGVVPAVRWLDESVDARAYIWSTNGTRRHLTAGQRAMTYALGFPETTNKGGRGKASTGLTVSREYLSRARAILKYRDLVAQVMANTCSLNEAHKQATDRDAITESRQEVMSGLRAEASDLADLVDEQRMSLDEALAAARERQRIAKATRFGEQKLLRELNDLIDVVLKHPSNFVRNQSGFSEEFASEVGCYPADLADRLARKDLGSLFNALREIR